MNEKKERIIFDIIDKEIKDQELLNDLNLNKDQDFLKKYNEFSEIKELFENIDIKKEEEIKDRILKKIFILKRNKKRPLKIIKKNLLFLSSFAFNGFLLLFVLNNKHNNYYDSLYNSVIPVSTVNYSKDDKKIVNELLKEITNNSNFKQININLPKGEFNGSDPEIIKISKDNNDAISIDLN